MRIFLTILLTDIIGHSILALFPTREWSKEFSFETYPLELPHPELRQRLRDKESDRAIGPLAERYFDTLDSFWAYWKPWPDEDVRKKIKGKWDVAKFGVVWTYYHMSFFENLVYAPQKWTMFSPNVGKWDVCVRARLIYEDGSHVTVRTLAEPEDITHYESFRFATEKRLQYSTKLDRHGDIDARVGYCNLLAHRHAKNEAGSPLVKILLVEVRYDYPEPGEGSREDYEELNVPLGEETRAPFFEYDPRTRNYRRIHQ